MISNEERRAAAARLRQFLSEPWNERSWYHDSLQNVGSLVGTSVGENILERLANLIDRPTCKPKDRGRGYVDAVCDSFCCPNCGFEIDVHIGEDQHLTEAAKYCPNCGAEVQE